ncbi:hypothetical protein IFM47457_06084 [Aspergillus lentulus]|nr:hypothetical protein IFM47457_06084 [Aspergillus lentulus]
MPDLVIDQVTEVVKQEESDPDSSLDRSMQNSHQNAKHDDETTKTSRGKIQGHPEDRYFPLNVEV